MLTETQKQTLLYDLFQAYYDARKNKRNTENQRQFEFCLSENMINLYEELINGTYEIWRSIYFIQNHPVKREIFAGDFRDRIIHHLIYNRISPTFEKDFIYDSYSCRVGKGTSMGVKRMSKFVRSCSENYTKDCYILKLDIQGYFMSMNKDILYEKIEKSLKLKAQSLKLKALCHSENQIFLLNLINKVVYNDCTKNSLFKGKKENYIGLPKSKSLFFAKPNCGLPIGNLTSQLFSNVYLSDFDKFIKHKLGIKYYGRYVDDFILIHKDKEYLKILIQKIRDYLKTELGLTLHPKKIYLQHYTKGVLFLGVMIKPHRNYIRKRTIGYFYEKIQKLNMRLVEELCGFFKGKIFSTIDGFDLFFHGTNIASKNKITLSSTLKDDFLSIVNSYLGFMKHCKNYKKRKNLLTNTINLMFWRYFKLDNDLIKISKIGTLKKLLF